MWIVILAINRPYTFVVVSMLLAFCSVLMAMRMAVDVFPTINIPVVSVIWTFTGLSPEEMESRIVSVSERAMTTVTSDIEHMESVSLSGLGIIRVFLHQGADMGQGVALMSAINQNQLIYMPPGITPPAVVAFSATDVPVMQLGVSSNTLTEAQLYDYDLNFIRTRLATVAGASIPLPYGGKQRQVMIDLYPNRLLNNGISPTDVVNALGDQNIILPAGLARMGTQEYPIRINGSPMLLDEFNRLPIKQINNATIYIKDIGFAHDGYSIQTNIVRMNGHRATVLNILRAGGASTLNVVQGIKDTLPLLRATLPKSLNMEVVNDQSQFVRGAITQVVNEAITAAVLTGLLMLALLGSWRSTLIVATSIPLSIMTSIIGLGCCGQTLNMMTLGGLALAVGMLVDDATVEVENIHRNLDLRLPLREAVLTSAAQVALPAFVSTLSICIVFVPVTLLTEPSRSLFVPLGMAVVFAMLASYFLSRTLVPVMSVYLLKKEELPGAKLPEGMTAEEAARIQAQKPLSDVAYDEATAALTDDNAAPLSEPPEHGAPPGVNPEEECAEVERPERPERSGLLGSISGFVDRRFHAVRCRYRKLLEGSLANRAVTVIAFTVFFFLSFCLVPFIGQDFFPVVDAGLLRLHLVCPVGTRVDDTDLYFSRVEMAIRRIIPADEITSVTLNMGYPASGLSLCYGDNTNFTEFDGEMLIGLNQKHHGSTFKYQRQIRAMLAREFPMLAYYFQPADITNQILNAGLQAPIDIQVMGLENREENYKLALAMAKQVRLVPGAVDVLVRQALHEAQINVDVDRSKAINLGLSQQDVASSVLTSLTSSFQTNPSFWVNPDNGVNYTVAVQTPLYKMRHTEDIERTLITGTSGLLRAPPQNGYGQNTSSASSASTNLATQIAPAAQPSAVAQSTAASFFPTVTQTQPGSSSSVQALVPSAPAAGVLGPLSATAALSVNPAALQTTGVPASAQTVSNFETASIAETAGATSAAGQANAGAGSAATGAGAGSFSVTSVPTASTALTALTSQIAMPSITVIGQVSSQQSTSSIPPQQSSSSASQQVSPASTNTASSTSSTATTTPSTATVLTLTNPSTGNIAQYLTTPNLLTSATPGVSPTANPFASQTTLPSSAAPITLSPATITQVATYTTPSTLSSTQVAAVAQLTSPSFLNVISQVVTPQTLAQSSAAASSSSSSISLVPGQGTSITPISQLTVVAQAEPIAQTSSPTLNTGDNGGIISTLTSGPTTNTGLFANFSSPTTNPTSTAAAGSQIPSNVPVASSTSGLGVFSQVTAAPGVASLLMNLAGTRHSPTSAMVSHYAIQPVFDIFANTEGRDLGGVARDIENVVARFRDKAPVGTLIFIRGQADSMHKAFSGLIVGMVFALILIYLLLVVNFQSWLDPLIILMAIPGALSGIVWALFITQTTFSVPALMGAIMSIGVGSANSILMVNFANEQLHGGDPPTTAASKAGYIRFRPVVMTAMAMIIGMLPMATGLGEGGGQNAPLGRAVIGGLIVATFSTLFFVPVMYSLMKGQRKPKSKQVS
jgi:multidrug efflux pump subunit AcrB